MVNVNLYIFNILLFLTAIQVSGYVYDKCRLAKKMLDLEVPLEDIPVYICLANYTSNLNMKFINSGRYGLFGAREKHWCMTDDDDINTTKVPTKIRCEETTKFVSKAVSVAMMAKNMNGFGIFTGYNDVCINTTMTYLNDCGNFMNLYQILDKYCSK